jgi:hypothetical protein
MANFGARLAYPIPQRIVNRTLEGRPLAAREAIDPWLPLRSAMVGAVRALLASLTDHEAKDVHAPARRERDKSASRSRRVA